MLRKNTNTTEQSTQRCAEELMLRKNTNTTEQGTQRSVEELRLRKKQISGLHDCLPNLLDHDTCYKLHSLTSKTSLKMQTLSHVQVFLHWLIKKIMGTTSCYNLHCPWLKKQAEKIKKKQIFY